MTNTTVIRQGVSERVERAIDMVQEGTEVAAALNDLLGGAPVEEMGVGDDASDGPLSGDGDADDEGDEDNEDEE